MRRTFAGPRIAMAASSPDTPNTTSRSTKRADGNIGVGRIARAASDGYTSVDRLRVDDLETLYHVRCRVVGTKVLWYYT
jgi:hypothetical protein